MSAAVQDWRARLLPPDLLAARQALDDWQAVRSTPKRWETLRKFYGALQERLEDGERLDPYFIDWTMEFSPIEDIAWAHIRELGLRFWPQYPIDRFFVDFADPVQRIALECDGKAYHDAAKDAKRDDILRSLGWRVIRMTGRSLVLDDKHPDSARHVFRYLAGQYDDEKFEDDDE